MRSAADRAWAVNPSASARTTAVAPSRRAAASEHWITFIRFWKSYTPSGEENRADRPVGSTWFGPAQ